MFSLIGLVVVGALIFSMVSRLRGGGGLFGQAAEAGAAQIRKGIFSFWRRDPMAIYHEQLAKAQEQLQASKESLVSYRANLTTMTQRQKAVQENVTRLDARVRAAVAAGNTSEAARQASTLVKEKALLERYTASLTQETEAYNTQVALVKQNWDAVEAKKEQEESFRGQLAFAKDKKRLSENRTTLSSQTFDSYFTDVEQEIAQQINEGDATLIVDEALGLTHTEDPSVHDEAVQQLLAQYQAPAQLAAPSGKIGE